MSGAGGSSPLGWLLRVKLDDELLADGDVDLLPYRQVSHGVLETHRRGLAPGRGHAAPGVQGAARDDELAGALPEGPHVAPPEPVATAGYPLAVSHTELR